MPSRTVIYSSPLKLNRDEYTGSSSTMQLPQELWDHIAIYLSPLSRIISGIPTSGQGGRSAEFGHYIFETETWINEVFEIRGEIKHQPIPSILGRDLPRVVRGNTEGSYLTLLLHDWGGDAKFLRKQFFQSLQPYSYDKEKEEIFFLNSGITLHIFDVTHGLEWVKIPDPRKLFRLRMKKLSTNVIYYNEDIVRTIDDVSIGGVQGTSRKRKKAVAEICYIKLHSRSGRHLHRVFISSSKSTRVVSILDPETSEVVGWRQAGPWEPECWVSW